MGGQGALYVTSRITVHTHKQALSPFSVVLIRKAMRQLAHAGVGSPEQTEGAAWSNLPLRLGVHVLLADEHNQPCLHLRRSHEGRVMSIDSLYVHI